MKIIDKNTVSNNNRKLVLAIFALAMLLILFIIKYYDLTTNNFLNVNRISEEPIENREILSSNKDLKLKRRNALLPDEIEDILKNMKQDQ